ncbi:unnamed protein product [Sphagnum tenellum]
MTKGIIAALNLPSMEDVLREQGVLPDKSAEDVTDDNVSSDVPDSELMRTVEMAQQAQTRLDMVEGTDHAIALDKVFTETLKHAQDLMDLGFNVDIPRARGIFEVAANMYGQAISAKNSKRDAQLKAMKLALDQRKLDLDEKRLNAQLGETEKNTIVGEATVIKEDRNELIKRMREKKDGLK